MRWADLEGGDVRLSSNGKCWLMLEARLLEKVGEGGRELIWLRWLDLRSGRVHAAEQDGSRAMHGGEVLRGEEVVTLET